MHETARMSKSIDTEGELVIEGGWGKGEMTSVCKGCGVSVWGD